MEKDFTLDETAEKLRVKTRAVLKAIQRGELKAYRIGRFWRITPESIDSLRRGDAPDAA
jgi:excisionase family DNA binding protein